MWFIDCIFVHKLRLEMTWGSLGPRPTPFWSSVCVHNNTRGAEDQRKMGEVGSILMIYNTMTTGGWQGHSILSIFNIYHFNVNISKLNIFQFAISNFQSWHFQSNISDYNVLACNVRLTRAPSSSTTDQQKKMYWQNMKTGLRFQMVFMSLRSKFQAK